MREEDEMVTPERALLLLRKDGMDVDLEQAKMILNFLSEMAEIVVNQYLNENKNS